MYFMSKIHTHPPTQKYVFYSLCIFFYKNEIKYDKYMYIKTAVLYTLRNIKKKLIAHLMIWIELFTSSDDCD